MPIIVYEDVTPDVFARSRLKSLLVLAAVMYMIRPVVVVVGTGMVTFKFAVVAFTGMVLLLLIRLTASVVSVPIL
jgi:hypothetical protein